MIRKILSVFTFMKTKQKESFFSKLVKEDTNVSVMNFFLMATLAVGVILLFVPVIGILVDIWYNHTITINLADLGSYIVAVAGIFAAGGLSSAWTEFAYSKYKIPPITEEDMARSKEAANAINSAGEDTIILEENLNRIDDSEEI